MLTEKCIAQNNDSVVVSKDYGGYWFYCATPDQNSAQVLFLEDVHEYFLQIKQYTILLCALLYSCCPVTPPLCTLIGLGQLFFPTSESWTILNCTYS